jgi:hypothetical protein
MKHPLDLTGEIFGSLTVLGRDNAQSQWRCRCVCGTETTVRTGNLRLAKGDRCTCAIREKTRARRRSHGESGNPEYRAWSEMKTRCENQASTSYADYGGRGIQIDPRWATSFETFLADMGRKPTPRHTLDRRDTEKGYGPDNCRWATQREQQNNRRNNHLLTHEGITLTTSEWARRVGLSPDALERRLNLLKWSVEKALTTPERGWGPGRPKVHPHT